MKENNKIQPLNSTLPEFFLDDVERRLETDPLTLGGLVDLIDPSEAEPLCVNVSTCSCHNHEGSCINLRTCDIDN